VEQAQGAAGSNESQMALAWAQERSKAQMQAEILAAKHAAEKRQLDQKMIASMLQTGQKAEQRHQQLFAKTREGVAKSNAQYQAQRAAAKAKAAASKQPPNATVNAILEGTDTKKINPVQPMSGAPADAGGSATAKNVATAALGGRMAQTQGPVSELPPGAGPDQALQAAMGPGGQGAGGPMSLNVGGQQFTAPDTIQRQVSEVGAQPIRTSTGFSMAPTFSTRTITEPNVLTAGDVMRGTIQQRASEADMMMKLTQMSGNAQAAATAARAYHSGDLETLSLAMDEIGAPLLAAQRADLDMKRQMTEYHGAMTLNQRVEAFVELYGRLPTSLGDLFGGTGGEAEGPLVKTVPEILGLAGADRFTNAQRNLTPSDLMKEVDRIHQTYQGMDLDELSEGGKLNALNVINAMAAMDQIVFLQPKKALLEDLAVEYAGARPNQPAWQLKDMLALHADAHINLEDPRFTPEQKRERRAIKARAWKLLEATGGWVPATRTRMVKGKLERETYLALNDNAPYSQHAAQIVESAAKHIRDDVYDLRDQILDANPAMTQNEAMARARQQIDTLDVMGFRRRRTQRDIDATRKQKEGLFAEWMRAVEAGGGSPTMPGADLEIGRKRLQEFESQPTFQE
jgi:hypothetical protein